MDQHKTKVRNGKNSFLIILGFLCFIFLGLATASDYFGYGDSTKPILEAIVTPSGGSGTSNGANTSGGGTPSQLAYWSTPTMLSSIGGFEYDFSSSILKETIPFYHTSNMDFTTDPTVYGFDNLGLIFGTWSDFLGSVSQNYRIFDNNGNLTISSSGYLSGVIKISNNNLNVTKNITATCYNFGDGSTPLCTTPTGSSMNYNNIAMNNKTNNFTQNQNIIGGNFTMFANSTNEIASIVYRQANSTEIRIQTPEFAGGIASMRLSKDISFGSGLGFYLLGSTYGGAGRMYLGCQDASGNPSACRMNLQYISQFESFPSLVSMQQGTTSSCVPGSTCSAITSAGRLSIGDTLLGGYITGLQFGGHRGVSMKSYSNSSDTNQDKQLFQWGSQYNKAQIDPTKSNHTAWTVGTSEIVIATLGMNGDLAVNGTLFVPKLATVERVSISNVTNNGMDRCALVSGACTIANTLVTTSTNIFCFEQSQGGTIGSIGISGRNAGVNYTVSSSNVLDTSIVGCMLVEPNALP